MIKRPVHLEKKGDLWVGRFDAMASPCEIIMALKDEDLAGELLFIGANEAWRIEQKYSRYRDDGIVPIINKSGDKPVIVDEETAQLLDFSYQCYQLSDGLFDISSGVLRKAWPFNNRDTLPSQTLIDSLIPFVGLSKAQWRNPEFILPKGMQIDFGGIGKEYAVDRTLGLLLDRADIPFLVNFGGDLSCNRCPGNENPWMVGVEDPNGSALQNKTVKKLLEVRSGAIATSGSTQRYILVDGKRYGHVLNPQTGWPVEHAPLSVTVAAENCTQAGMLATFAMLRGENAEDFLQQQQVTHWVIR